MIIAAVALVTLGLAAAYTALTPRTYAATTQFFVSTSGDDTTSSLAQGNTFTQARVKSYSRLLESPKVLDPVIKKVGLDTTADRLASQVTSTIPLDTVIIDVSVTSGSPASAQRIAAAVGDVFPQTIQEIERKQGQESPVKVTVVKEAAVDTTPVSPKPTRNLALGLVLGLLLGFGVALLRDVLDKSVKSQRDLEAVTDRTILGGIAFDTDASAHPLIVQVDPRSQRAEAFRSLRTNLQFIDVANPPKSIVVTSSLPGEGKSTTTANLALSLAETGLKVVVIEGDLRRPRLLDYLGFEGSVGLTDVLVGRVEVDDVLQPFGRTGLRLLGAGPIPPNPSELLGSANMEQARRGPQRALRLRPHRRPAAAAGDGRRRAQHDRRRRHRRRRCGRRPARARAAGARLARGRQRLGARPHPQPGQGQGERRRLRHLRVRLPPRERATAGQGPVSSRSASSDRLRGRPRPRHPAPVDDRRQAGCRPGRGARTGHDRACGPAAAAAVPGGRLGLPLTQGDARGDPRATRGRPAGDPGQPPSLNADDGRPHDRTVAGSSVVSAQGLDA